MKETREFLRYIMPGLLFGIETVLLLSIVIPTWTSSYILRATETTASVVLAFFGTGAIGYFLSVAHHQWHWLEPQDHSRSPIDFRPAVKRWINAKYVELDPNVEIEEVSRLQAWIIVSALWLELRKDQHGLESSDARANSLNDLFHATGAARMAAILAATAAAWIIAAATYSSREWPPLWRIAIAVVVAVSVWYLFHRAYRRTGKISQWFTAQVLGDALAAAATKNGPRVSHQDFTIAPKRRT